jgi:hypothetical protein
MSVSDTLPPYRGNQSDFWAWYAAIGLGMFLAAIVLLWGWRAERRAIPWRQNASAD